MNNNPFIPTSAAIIALSSLISLQAFSECETSPSEPTGTITGYPIKVQQGTKPTLIWSITYPKTLGGGGGGGVDCGGGGGDTDPTGGGGGDTDPTGGGGGDTDPTGGGGGTDPTGGGSIGGGEDGTSPVVIVDSPGSLTPTQQVYATVQIVGTGVTSCNAAQDELPTYTEARVSLNGGAYQQLFYGTKFEVNPAKELYIKRLKKGDTLNFGGRMVRNGAYSQFFTTKSVNRQVITLVNGSSLPTKLAESPVLADYLKPYVNPTTKKVVLGPLSVLVLMELGQTNRSASCFDNQDQVLLVTFTAGHPNNGHGNNLDGVDSSNPGNGHGGPNGMEDLSKGFDDEIKPN